jgi:hypothetical protein
VVKIADAEMMADLVWMSTESIRTHHPDFDFHVFTKDEGAVLLVSEKDAVSADDIEYVGFWPREFESYSTEDMLIILQGRTQELVNIIANRGSVKAEKGERCETT